MVLRMILDQLRAGLADRYRIEREIGVGGMATVYLAQDLKHNRQVAIKVLRPELSAALGAERFRREIEVAASLHHPHILPLFDSGSVPSGHDSQDSGLTPLLYYVMPFEDGPTLRQRLEKDGQLPIAIVTRYMREIADGLAHAHERGIAHRDIKPENVLLSNQHALITDFGIAKATAEGHRPEEESPRDLLTLTQAGTSIGTPAYMAPEQIAGDASTDHRADIYALGVMAYEMLAGTPPFTGTSAQQILTAHLTVDPAPLATHRKDVPLALESIVMRCLAKDPAVRWQTAAELQTALEAIDGGPQHAASRRWPLIAAAAVLLLGVGGFVWYRAEGRVGTLIGNDLLAANDQVMVAEFENRTPDSTLAETVTDAVRIELQESSVIRIPSQTAMRQTLAQMQLASASGLDDTRVREMAERLGAKAYVTGSVAPIGGGYQLTARVVATVTGAEALVVRTTAGSDAELIDAVGELGRKLRRGIGESLRSVADAPTLAIATTASLPALKAYTAARRAEAGGDRPRAIALFHEAIGEDSTFASAWAGLGVAFANSSNWTGAVGALTKAYEHREGLPDNVRMSIEINYHVFRGEPDLAEPILKRRTELYNDGWTSYADLLLGQGKLAAAESAGVRGVATQPKEPVSWWNLVEAQVAQQHFAAAESTIVRMEQVLPGNAWVANLDLGILEGRRDFDSLRTIISNGPLASTPQSAEILCGLNLVRGKLGAWQQCGPPDEDPHLIIATLRMTGDTARARQQLVQVTSAGVDTVANFARPSLIAAYAEIGDLPAARRELQRWQGALGPNDPRYRSDSPYAMAAIAMAEGKFDSAATAYLAWNRSGHLDAGHWYNRGLAEAGMALDRAGKSDSAMVLFEKALSMPSISGGTYYESAWYPEVLRRLGELHEARGDRARALEYYQKLLTLWKNAEPVLKPQVDAVRERVATLAGERNAPP